MEKKEILCYGDSNTWGCIPRWADSDRPSERYDARTRWPCVVQTILGDGYHIVEEGMGGRTTIYDLPGEPEKNGERYLLPCLLSHRPLDMVIIMLGTNDLNWAVQPDWQHMGDGIRRLIDLIQATPKCGRGNRPPEVMVLSPLEIRPASAEGRVGVYQMFAGNRGRELSQAFPDVYRAIAAEKGCAFLAAGDYACADDGDGVHFTPESHVRLGRAVAESIREHRWPVEDGA